MKVLNILSTIALIWASINAFIEGLTEVGIACSSLFLLNLILFIIEIIRGLRARREFYSKVVRSSK